MTGYFAPTSRFGSPDDFRAFVDRLHQRGVGVILDWVPAHFPRDDWALARFDGTALYEHEDPRRGFHPDWGTLVFNYGRNEVRNFLLANALFWLREYHADGLRVDAVASMLYLDYSREEGQWVPNEFGGNEDLDAVSFLKELNEVVHGREPGTLSVAEESTAWPGVSRPTYLGGLGFGFKWNMGWMHDTLDYFQRDPVHRALPPPPAHVRARVRVLARTSCCRSRTTRSCTARARCCRRCPATAGRSSPTCARSTPTCGRIPGKKLLFMGGEIAQEAEWSEERSVDWHLLEQADHAGVQALVRDLNRVYRGAARALGGRLRAERLPVAGAERREQQHPRLRTPFHGRLGRGRLRLQPLTRCRGPTIASACRAPAAGSRRSTPTPRTTAARTSATSAASSQTRSAGTISRTRPK